MATEALDRAIVQLIEKGDGGRLVPFYASDVTFAAHLPGRTLSGVGVEAARSALGTWELDVGTVTSCSTRNYSDHGAERGGVEAIVEWRRGADETAMRQRHYLRRNADGLVSGHAVFPERVSHGVPPEACGPLVDSLRARAQSRDVVSGHSGAVVERLRFESEPPLVVKHWNDSGWHSQVTNDSGREAELFLDGTLDRLPTEMTHAVTAVERTAAGWAIVQRDLTRALARYPVSKSTFQAFLAALGAAHASMEVPERTYLASVDQRLGLWWPRSCEEQLQGSDAQPKIVARGWDLLDAVVPTDVVEIVRSVASDPAALIAALGDQPSCVLHGDAHFANLAVEDYEFTLLDWGLATWGPPALEGAWLANFGHHFTFSVAEALEGVRRVWHLGDSPALDQGLLGFASSIIPASLSDAVDHPDPAHRLVMVEKVADWVQLCRSAVERTAGT